MVAAVFIFETLSAIAACFVAYDYSIKRFGQHLFVILLESRRLYASKGDVPRIFLTSPGESWIY